MTVMIHHSRTYEVAKTAIWRGVKGNSLIGILQRGEKNQSKSFEVWA